MGPLSKKKVRRRNGQQSSSINQAGIRAYRKGYESRAPGAADDVRACRRGAGAPTRLKGWPRLAFLLITFHPLVDSIPLVGEAASPGVNQCLASNSRQQQQQQHWSPLTDWPDLKPLIQRSEHSVILKFNNKTNAQQLNYANQASSSPSPTSVDSNQQTTTPIGEPRLSRQEPFLSICFGWRNVISANSDHSLAFALWSYDPSRAALVAKFLFYERGDLLEFSSRTAILRSPKLGPIPADRLDSCKIRFSSLSTIQAHLEVSIVDRPAAHHAPPPTGDGQSNGNNNDNRNAQQQAQEPQAFSRIQILKTSIEGKMGRGRSLAEKFGEQRAWLWHELSLSGSKSSQYSLGADSSPTGAHSQQQQQSQSTFQIQPPEGHFRLEFTAIPGMITSAPTRRFQFLHGVALRNITLSDECFSAAASGDLRFNDGDYPSNSDTKAHEHRSSWADKRKPASSNGGPIGNRNAQRELAAAAIETEMDNGQLSKVSWFSRHKMPFWLLAGASLVLALGSLLQICLVRRALITTTTTNNQGAVGPCLSNNQSQLTHFCLLPCCEPRRRDRVHAASTKKHDKNNRSTNPHGLSAKQNGSCGRLFGNGRRRPGHGLASGSSTAGRRRPGSPSPSQESLQRSLFALGQMLDDVELNENPQYKSILLSEAKRLSPLMVYQIDRKRLTLTRLLGKGAFGQVYQGYLVCYNSGDSELERPVDEEQEQRATHSGAETSADEEDEQDSYSRLDRRRRLQRRLEYANCSQSREQLDSHSIPVAVKILTENGLKKIDFLLEATSMSMLSHRNIVGFIGVSFEEEPRYLVMEYLAGGNLKQFLIKNRPTACANTRASPGSISSALHNNNNESSFMSISFGDQTRAQHAHWAAANSPGPKLSSCSSPNSAFETTTSSNNQNNNDSASSPSSLNMGDLLVIALDIARACDYLQKRKIIHRDLAARNCLLTSAQKRFPSSSQLLFLPPSSTPTPLAQQRLSAATPTTANSTAPEPQRFFSGSRFMSSFMSGAGAASTVTPSNASNNDPFCLSPGPPSALEVDANHKVDLDQVYLNGFQESGIVAKLADFGMTREIEQNSDYYRASSCEMPIRWMPPESLNGITTNKSDVWSFGVLMWELFSLGQLPYSEIADNNHVYRLIRARVPTPSRPPTGGAPSKNTSSWSLETSPIPAARTTSNDENLDSPSRRIKSSKRLHPPPARHAHQRLEELSVASTLESPLLLASTRASDQEEEEEGREGVSSPNVNKTIEREREAFKNDNDDTQAGDCSIRRAEKARCPASGPPLPKPYPELPHPIYAIMCACWADTPEERPQFEEVANRLYWCLQMPDLIASPLLAFPPPLTPDSRQINNSTNSPSLHPDPHPLARAQRKQSADQFTWWTTPP